MGILKYPLFCALLGTIENKSEFLYSWNVWFKTGSN